MNELSDDLGRCIHYRFTQVKLAATAMTHSSFANEQTEECEHNERLEYLGDAVLELTVSAELFQRFPEADEGVLTRIRSRLVKERSLAELARELGLHAYLKLGRGEESQGGRDRDSLLADCLEAVLGAVFMDGGYEVARQCVLRLFEDRWPESAELPKPMDYKSRLQEITQSRFKARPVYILVDATGPEHEKSFQVRVELPEGRAFEARGPSLKKAEQMAASQGVGYYKNLCPPPDTD